MKQNAAFSMSKIISGSMGRFAGLSAAGLLFLAGCGKTPEACFSVEDTLVDQNEVVVFSNCSIYQQQGYLWDFGDGTTSDSPGASHAFTAQGEFLVSLTNRGKTSATDDVTTQIIKVGKRILLSIQVTSLPATDGNGNPWDATDAADAKVLYINNGTVVFESDVNTDLNVAPPYNISVLGSVDLTPTVWTMAIVDVDGATVDTMASFTIDLNTFIPNPQQQIDDTSADADWSLLYSLE